MLRLTGRFTLVRQRGAVIALASVAVAAGSVGCGASGDAEDPAAERDAAIEQRIDRERDEAARDARQEERIRRLERELNSRTSTSSGAGRRSASAVAPSGAADSAQGAPGDDWPGGSGYTVVLASETSESAARATQRRASDAGLDAGMLRSGDYSSLRAGYWVVFSGVYSASDTAKERQTRARSLGFTDAYVRFVAP